MAFPSGWGRKCALVISTTNVDADLTDFTLILTKDTLPSEMLDADGSYPALNGGGDIRFSTGSDGTGQIPCDIRTFTTNNTPANGVADIAVKCNLSGTSNTTIYVWYNKSGETQPAVDNAYGQYAAYDDSYVGVYPMNDVTTSTIANRKSSSFQGTKGAANNPAEVAGVCDKAQDFDGEDYIGIGDAADTTTNISISACINPDSVTENAFRTITGKRGVSVNWVLRKGSGRSTEGYCGFDGELTFYHYSGAYKIYHSTNADLVAVEWCHVACSYTGSTNPIIYKNGAACTGDWGSGYVGPAALVANNDNAYIGAYDTSAGEPWLGLLDEVRLSVAERSAAWFKAEYYNLLDTANFITEGTPETHETPASVARNIVIGGGIL